MNCQECRKHLHPYLDDELEITQNLGILEHLNCCTECREIFSLEELSWRALKERLLLQSAPSGFQQRVEAALWASDRRLKRNRTTAFLAGAAAVLLIFLGVQQLQDASDDAGGGTGDQVAAEGAHERPRAMPAHRHGPGIAACVKNFKSLMRDASARGSDVLNRDFLEHAQYRVTPEKFHACMLTRLVAAKTRIPERLCETTTRVAYRKVQMLGMEVLHGVFDCDGQEIGIYQLTSDQARLAGLEDLSHGAARRFVISHCKDCKVVAVTGEDHVWILVTRPGTEAAIAFARQVF